MFRGISKGLEGKTEASGEDMIGDLLSAFLGGGFGRIAGLDESNTGFLSGRTLNDEELVSYLTANIVDQSLLKFTRDGESWVLSLPAEQWRDTMLKLIFQVEKEADGEIISVLCSHQAALRQGKELKAFLAYMTDERLLAAPAVDMGAPINTHQVTVPEKGWILLFDADK